MAEQSTEPTTQPPPTHAENKFNGAVERTAAVLTSIVAVFLVTLVGVALVGAIVATLQPLLTHDYARAAVGGLDATFLAIILLELVHTTLSRGPITRQVQEFLVVGITGGVRSGLEVAAERSGESQAVALSMAITAGAVLLLVAALWLVRQRLHAEGGDPERGG